MQQDIVSEIEEEKRTVLLTAWKALCAEGATHGFKVDVVRRHISYRGVTVRAFLASPGDLIFEQVRPEGGPRGPFCYAVRRKRAKASRNEEVYRGLMDALYRAIDLANGAL
jgi:hypothetical protein